VNLHNGYELTTQIVEALQAAGLSVGRAVAPTTSTSQGYVVVYPLTGGTFDGAIDAPNSEARASYQLTSVSASAQQCEWLADKARRTLVAADLTLTDRGVVRIDPVFMGGVMREDDGGGAPLFYSPERFTVWTDAA